MTLTEFLKARVAEDEAAATKLMRSAQDHHLAVQEPRLLGTTIPGWYEWPEIEKLARHLLTEAGAKWQILAAYDATAETDTRQAGVGRAALAHVLRCLAAVYADHPDYDPEWAPDA